MLFGEKEPMDDWKDGRMEEQQTTDNSTDLKFLDPKYLQFYRAEGGALRLTIKNEICYLKVKATKAFPLSIPYRYIGFRDGADKEIGLVKDIADLPPEPRKLVDEELQKRYFTPIVLKIKSIQEKFGFTEWIVTTDKGERRFLTKGIHDNVAEVGMGRLMVTDADGNRYEIPDVEKLDARSLNLLNQLI